MSAEEAMIPLAATMGSATTVSLVPAPSHMRALRDIINVLGPEQICDCDHDPDCGLREEAAEALRIATQAMGKAHDGQVAAAALLHRGLRAQLAALRASEDEAWTSHVHRPKVLDDGRIVCGVEKREWPCPDASDADVAAIALTVRTARLEAVAEILSLIQRSDDEPDCDDAETCIDCAYVHGLRAAAGRLLDPEES